ncbi:hypothetical protein SAMN03159338_3647 [Sphingomonas sp. NFR04]|uniref:hypothetical protein n=1 Tax=Sphingomonas sp. NFR04 TaxID=1566283 RepID=UPI0008EA7A1F|nr:hypothetical protein [Sphingomonas sp. NFR04]SFK23940.1 hypothetical protein SAMN03159338_3647 [Sphingomonas sp. NFR04]
MPIRTDRKGNRCDVPDWPGNSYKAHVINRAYRNGDFEYVREKNVILFTCFWCKNSNLVSAAIEGDHIVTQSAGRSSDPELRGLFEEAEQQGDGIGYLQPIHPGARLSRRVEGPWNLEISCSECNGGTRNKQGRMLRSAYARDRDAQGPRPVD